MANPNSNTAIYQHRYLSQQREGERALSEAECPYHASAGELGKRCAWLAGFRDKHPERARPWAA
ncbi:hypothetical protein [Pseudomonas segetis]|uniref:Ribosome modulation factor n=1 Tax=Pseudomonas segetis TaxID=298908 RepID=A0A239C933_9PSED|nr:hypothetical protein [Pseudomonas segetis]SNS16737.1 hypothetical protein SAMN05216255_1579 [Pseudomonas segetis]